MIRKCEESVLAVMNELLTREFAFINLDDPTRKENEIEKRHEQELHKFS